MTVGNTLRFRVSEALARNQVLESPHGAFAYLRDLEEPSPLDVEMVQADLSDGVVAMLAGFAAELRTSPEAERAWVLASEDDVPAYIASLVAHALGVDTLPLVRRILHEVRSWVDADNPRVFEWGELATVGTELVLRAKPLPLDSWAVARDGQVRHVLPSAFLEGRTARPSYTFSEDTLQRAAVLFAERGDNTLLPRAIEYGSIVKNWDDLRRTVSSVEVGKRRIADYRQVLAPKSSPGYRIGTQLDPLDGLLQCACVLELGEAMEARRVPATRNIVHSFRFDGRDRLWSADHTYSTFRQHALRLANETDCDFVLEADIADFYPALPQPVIERALKKAVPRSPLIDAAMSMLGSFSNVGLPVGPTTSAFFAEAALVAVDERLLASGAVYVRYSDDFVFFCKRGNDVFKVLALLEDSIEDLGLSLQRGKTQMNPRERFIKNAEQDAWLAGLRAMFYEEAPSDEGQPLPSTATGDIARARALLLTSVGPDHQPWIRIGREALKALPLETRFELMPGLLAEFHRIVAMASSLATTVTQCGATFAETRQELLSMVLDAIIRETVGDGPNFGRAWLMNAFTSGEWPNPSQLFEALEKWPSDSLMLRELMLASSSRELGIHGSAVQFGFNPSDPWQRRAALAAGYASPSNDVGWSHQLDRAMAS